MTKISRIVAVALVCLVVAPLARADDVTDWNQVMLRAGLVAGTSPTTMTRVAAMVQVAVFDAVNGIDPKYGFFRVDPSGAPVGASKRAAAVQAAYAMLTKIYGSGAATPSAAQQATFDARRVVSLGEIAERDSTSSINAGIAWGQSVADAVFAWRSTDGFSVTAPFPDGTAVGVWRRTPNLPVSAALSAPGAGYLQLSQQTPWAIASPSAFRPGPPPAITSAEYARDFNETKAMGNLTSATRTADQTTNALFWNSATVSYLWNTAALSLIRQGDNDRDDDHWGWGHRRNDPLLEHARLLGVLDVAMADAIIGCWDAKYTYPYWRPVTAIRETTDDGNPATSPDVNWMPLFATPGHPEYPSGHSCGSGAAATVLAAEFGSRSDLTMRSDLMLGVTRSYRSFAAALEGVKDARIFSGIHFRTACNTGTDLGAAVARYVMQTKFQPLN
jgi:PAP2 superfamily